MGSKIVLNTIGSLGDLNPYLGIALGLKSMGHAPTIATAEVYREYVEGAGVDFHPVRPDVSNDDRETIRRVEKGHVDIEKVKPMLFDPEINTYHGVGNLLGRACSIGKEDRGV